MKKFHTAAGLGTIAAMAFAAGHVLAPPVEADLQSVENVVMRPSGSGDGETRWLAVHRINADRTPGSIVGYSRLRKGEIIDVGTILTEDIKPGEMLMLIVHSGPDGMVAGDFEAQPQSNAPVKTDGDRRISAVTAR